MLGSEAFLLDPDLMNDRTSNGSAISISRGTFRDKVIGRDGTCVMTGTAHFAACHIIPHAKGHQVCSECLLNPSEFSFHAKYMINLASHRHEDLDPPLDDINDTRNGILLAFQLHASFGASEVAFLQVSYIAQLSSMWLN
jgi:endonuclease IV